MEPEREIHVVAALSKDVEKALWEYSDWRSYRTTELILTRYCAVVVVLPHLHLPICSYHAHQVKSFRPSCSQRCHFDTKEHIILMCHMLD